MQPDFLVEQESKTPGIRVFRDEEIKTTWKISFNVGRFYRKADPLYATQDIKFDESQPQEDSLNQLYEKATAYHKRILKNKGWSGNGCGGSWFIPLNS